MNRILFLLVLTFSVSGISAKTINGIETPRYNRSSIYSILINHTEQKFANEIKDQFLNIPIPEQYDNHELNVKVVNVSDEKEHLDSITQFVNDNHIASRMIGKWFDRNTITGECTTNLIEERGIYNASELDRALAENSVRGQALLTDAGEELIGHSFLLVNEIKYIDTAKKTAKIAGGLKLFGNLAGAFVPGLSLITNLTDNVSKLVKTIKGFRVKITTHLYQLVWDDEAAATFYELCYTTVPDEQKRLAFENNRDKFRLNYVGKVESSGSTTSFIGINEDEPYKMVRKACQRALDNNISDLQKAHDQFRVKSPVLTTDGKHITAAIGKKEGIDTNSKYEVLEAEMTKEGKTIYRRVAIVTPVANKIWDNRYMATEEMATGADLGATTFKKESGGEIYSGQLLRQINN